MKRLLLGSAISLAGLFTFSGQAHAVCTTYGQPPVSEHTANRPLVYPLYGAYTAALAQTYGGCENDATSRDWVVGTGLFFDNPDLFQNVSGTGKYNDSASAASNYNDPNWVFYHQDANASASASISGGIDITAFYRNVLNTGSQAWGQAVVADTLFFEDEGLDADQTQLVEVPFEVCSSFSSSVDNEHFFLYGPGASYIDFPRLGISAWEQELSSQGENTNAGTAYTNNEKVFTIPFETGTHNKCLSGKMQFYGNRAVFGAHIAANSVGLGSREYYTDSNGDEKHRQIRDGNLRVNAPSITVPSGYICYSASGAFPGCERQATQSMIEAAQDAQAQKESLTDCIVAAAGDGGGEQAKSTPNPINFALGFKHKTQTDYSDDVLSFTRFYRSDSTWVNNVIGQRWWHNYDRSFNVFTNPRNTTSIDITDAGGVVTVFSKKGSGNVFSAVDADITSTLEAVTGGYIYTTNGDTREHYDSNGKLTRIEYRGGEAVDLSYDGSGRLSSVTDEEGDSLTFSYNGNNMVSSVVTPAGTFSYGYDGSGNLTSVSNPDSKSRTYHYENTNHAHALTGITDEKGVRFATYTYDAVGRAISSEHIGGVDNYTIAYNADGTTTTTNPLGKQTTYTFETINGVRKIVGVEGHQSASCAAANKAYSYNERGFLTSKTDWLGNVTNYSHDDRGLVTSITEDANGVARTTSITYEGNYRLADVISETGKTTDYDYDAQGRVTAVTVTDINTSEMRTVSYSYHPDTTDSNGNAVLGKLASIDGARTDVTDVTSYTYDAQGRLTKVTNALGHESEVTSFDSADRPLTVEDANNVVTTLSYDVLGRLLSWSKGGSSTSYTYDDIGNVLTVTQGNGVTLTYGYDDARRLTSITDALGNVVNYTHDAAGNVLSESYTDNASAVRYTHSRVYDELSRLIESVDANNDALTLAYDVNSNVTEVRDGNFNAATFAFDGLNRLANETDALSGVTSYALNNLNQTTGITDPRSNTTSYTYNAFGDVLSEVSPDRGTVTYTYDAAGNQLTRTDARGETVTYSYDALNRVSSTSYVSDSSLDESFTYDASSGCGYGVGRLCSVTDAGGSVSYVYDALGRLTDVTETRGSLSFTTNYGYDADGVLTGIVLPSGRIVSYTLNANAQVSGVDVDVNNGTDTVASAITYLPFGGVESLSYGNGVALSNSYNTAYQLTGKQHGSLFYEGYTYDNAGNITVKGSDNYTYDALYRLTNENGNSYSYDAIANRLSDPLNSYSYPSDSSRLSSINGNSVSLDAAGNLTADVSRSYTVDAAGHVETITMGGSVVATYTYDANHMRVKKDAGGTVTHYVYGAGGLLYGEYDALGNVVREYVYLHGNPIAQVDGGAAPSGESLLYLHTDHLGTPRIASNDSGVSVWAWDSDAFGVGSPTGSKTVNLRFAGQYWDDESGLHYNWNRYYDPATGRYISSDPIGLSGGLNTFAYVSANPVMFIDPEGLKTAHCDLNQWSCRIGSEGVGGSGIGGGGSGAIGLGILARAILQACKDAVSPNTESTSSSEDGDEGRAAKGGSSASAAAGGMPDPDFDPDDEGGESKNKSNTDTESLEDALSELDFDSAESYLDKKLQDDLGWTKKPLRDGNGVRYYDGSGKSVQLNKGYNRDWADYVHRHPYWKISQNGQIYRGSLGGR